MCKEFRHRAPAALAGARRNLCSVTVGLFDRILRERRAAGTVRAEESHGRSQSWPSASAKSSSSWSSASPSSSGWRGARTEGMRQSMFVLLARPTRRGLTEITDSVRSWVSKQQISAGLLTLFCRHTSASLLIQENAAHAVRSDLEKFFDELAPEGAD